MSKKARLKRALRLKGEKRIKEEKPAGMADHMIPGIQLDMLTDRLNMHDPGLSLIADSDQWLGRFEMSDENLDAAGDGLDLMQHRIRKPLVFKKDYASAGAWLQGIDNYGRNKDHCEAELPRNPDTVPGDELGSGEVQSRAGDHETLEEEGITPAETPDN